MKRQDKEHKGASELISVANLSPELIISNPKNLITEMRTSFLSKARESKGLLVEDVASKLHMPVSEITRIESGRVKSEDMMILHELSVLYDIDYYRLLTLFKLAEIRPDTDFAMAACHKANLDKETQEKVKDIAKKLRERLNE